jgi:hypothetical protein
MKKVDFVNHKLAGRVVKSTSDSYMLLSYFVGEHRFTIDTQETIEMLEIVQRGEKTWEELCKPYGSYQLGYIWGTLDVEDGEVMIFPDKEGQYEPVYMPIQELIDIMKEWKVFMS